MSIAVQPRVTEPPNRVTLQVPIDAEVSLSDDVRIPGGIVDLESFREWAHSDEFPERGRFDYLRGTVFADLSMEQAHSHNGVKNAYIITTEQVLSVNRTGRVFGDRMRISLPSADSSVEPDGMFISFHSIRTGKVTKKPGRRGGVLEFVGVPDQVLEVLSDSSEDKDRLDRPLSYRQAGVREFWRVDARGAAIKFELLVLVDGDYVAAETADGWQRSEIFGKWFKFEQAADELGDPLYTLCVRD